MPSQLSNASAPTDAELAPIFEDLRQREPIFHSPAFGTSTDEFARAMAQTYWEIGASGKRYTREFILNELYARPPALASALGWRTADHALMGLGSDTFLFTYTLHQGERVTRRATIWRRCDEQWQVLYHQGTVVSSEVPTDPCVP